MRGWFREQTKMFSYVRPGQRIPADHPLRAIRALARDVLKSLSHSLGKLYSHEGRPSIPPEQLISALLLQVLYGIRSERRLMEELDYNLLYRWFVGLEADDPVWDVTVFTKNRDRLEKGAIFQKFMAKLLEHEKVRPLLSDEHFSVDGTLIEAWASHKSFKPKDDKDGDGTDFHGQKRKNDTHQSTTDPQAKLYRKANGREAKLSFMGHAVMENRNGLAVDGCVSEANGTAERRASEGLLKRLAKRKRRHRGAAQNQCDAARGAERQRDEDRQEAQERHRCTDDPSHRLQDVSIPSGHDRVHLWLGQAARHHAQDQASRLHPRCLRFPAQPHRLQSRPYPQAHRGLRTESV